MVLALTPLPSLAGITLLDAIPLQPPSLGIRHSHLFWLRMVLTGTCLCAMILVQLRQSAARIPITSTQAACIAFTASASGTTCSFALSCRVGYPMPIALALASAPACAVIAVLLISIWADLLRKSAQARSELTNYIKLVVKKVTLVYIYPLYSYVFNSIGAQEQTAFALLLPVIKIAAKNWINASVVNVDDLKPEIIILNVEVFHALYVIYSMQSATSTSTIVVLVVVDVLSQSTSLRRLNNLTKSCNEVFQAERTPQTKVVLSAKPSSVDAQQQMRHSYFSLRQRWLKKSEATGSRALHPRDRREARRELRHASADDYNCAVPTFDNVSRTSSNSSAFASNSPECRRQFSRAKHRSSGSEWNGSCAWR